MNRFQDLNKRTNGILKHKVREIGEIARRFSRVRLDFCLDDVPC